MSATIAQPSLARRSFMGAAWSMGAYGGAQVLRFASSLILTRLLAPEYFGLMALVNVFLIGVNMFSDVGIGPNIVQSKRGGERLFLDTAWTLQLIRGCAIWLLCVLGAWPFSRFYDDPRLFSLLAVSGFAAVISGLNSTKMVTCYRDLQMGRVSLLEIGTQALTVLFTVSYAAISPSVWALVLASLFSASVKALASHWWLPGPNNRWSLDAGCIDELVKFGRWIFLSTILAFTSNSAASLILGKFLSVRELGIFSLATMLANIVTLAYEQVSSKVLFPLFARIKDLPLAELRVRTFKMRLCIQAAFLPPLCTMAIFGQYIIEHLFDARYHDGGWVFQLFSACAIPGVVTATGPFYLAMGNSLLSMQMSAAKLCSYLVFAFLGWRIGGTTGIIWGIALNACSTYTFDLLIQKRYGIWMPRLDLAALSICALVIFAGLKAVGQI